MYFVKYVFQHRDLGVFVCVDGLMKYFNPEDASEEPLYLPFMWFTTKGITGDYVFVRSLVMMYVS